MSKGNTVKTIGKELFVWAILFASAYFLAEQLTSWFTTTSLGQFVLNINNDFGWVVFVVVGLWALLSLMGAYAQYNKPLFIVGVSGLLINRYGTIEVPNSVFWAYLIMLFPYLVRIVDLFSTRLIGFIAIKIIDKTSNERTSFFKYDRFDKDNDKLHVGREQMVDTIVDQVRKLKHNDSSFTIGLEGGWGSGKTTLLNKIKSKLKGTTDAHGMTVEVVEFSPWAYPDGKSLSVEFLYELRDVLSKHSFRARFIINAYINALADRTTNVLQLLAMLFFPRESLQKVKAKLSDLLRFHRVKLVVIIDDLDRLDEAELVEVFKMLRNTGDLPNAVYIVAYSKKYVEELISQKGNDKQKKLTSNSYLDKVINAEIDINSFDSETLFVEFVAEARAILSREFFLKDDLSILHELRLASILNLSITNRREKECILNSLRCRVEMLEKINPKSLGIQLSPYIIVLIEIIKHYDRDFFDHLRSNSVFGSLASSRRSEFLGINGVYSELFYGSFGYGKLKDVVKRYYRLPSMLTPEFYHINYYLAQQTEILSVISQLAKWHQGFSSFTIDDIIFNNTHGKDSITEKLVVDHAIRHITFVVNNEENKEVTTRLVKMIIQAKNHSIFLSNKSLLSSLSVSIIEDINEPDTVIASIDSNRIDIPSICPSDELIYLLLIIIYSEKSSLNVRQNSVVEHINKMQSARFNWFIENNLIDEAFIFITNCIGPRKGGDVEIIDEVKASARRFINNFNKSSKYLTIQNMVKDSRFVGEMLCIGLIYDKFESFVSDLKDIKQKNRIEEGNELSDLIYLLDNDNIDPRREGLKYEINLAGISENKSMKFQPRRN